MFKGLQNKWKVNGWQLLVILVTFAVGGSLCGYLGRVILGWFRIEQATIRVPLYIILVTLLWPACVLLISIPLGQFAFFTRYLQKLGRRIRIGKAPAKPGTPSMTNDQQRMINIAIFASGAGSNAQKIIDHFHGHPSITMALIVCNKPGAGVLGIAARERIPTLLIDKEKFFRGNGYVDELRAAGIDFIVLAGFLWKLPATLVRAYAGHIINIHPAILPRYGGKGMYGMFVHNAVIDAKDKESGITIHFVDEVYDHGDVIFQATCPVEASDTPDLLAQKIHALEHTHYPRVIEEVVKQLQKRS